MKKITICFHGAILSLPSYHNDYKSVDQNKQINLPPLILSGLISFKKNVIDVNPAIEVYIHCWNKEYKEKILEILHPEKYIFQDKKIYKIPNKLSLFIFFLKSNFTINPFRLIKNFVILINVWGKKTNKARIQGVYSKWYSASKVLQLLENSMQKEADYEYVFLSRFDLFFLKPLLFSHYKKNSFHLPNTPDLYDENKNRVPLNLYYHKKNTEEIITKKSNNQFMNGVVDDLFFFSSFQNMKKIKFLFKMINLYYKQGVEINNHQLLYKHLKNEDLYNKIEFSVDRIFEIELTRRVINKSIY